MSKENLIPQFIKPNRHQVFWFAFMNAAALSDTNQELSNEWLDLAYNQIEPDNIKKWVETAMEVVLPALSKPLKREERIEWVLTKTAKNLNKEGIVNQKPRILEVFRICDGTGYLLRSRYSEEKLASMKSEIEMVMFMDQVARQAPKLYREYLEERHSDDFFIKLLSKHSTIQEQESTKKAAVLAIHEAVEKFFHETKDYTKIVLTAYCAAAMNWYDSEDQFNASSRRGTYHKYLINSVKRVLN